MEQKSERSSGEGPALDDIDRTIVAVLREDGRISIPRLAERVGIARATAYTRFDRLVDVGVIKGFTATVDPAAFGLGVAALLMVNAEQSDWAELAAQLPETYGVEWVGLTTGQFDFAVLVRAADLTELRDVVLQRLQGLPQVRSTQTVVLLDEIGNLMPVS